MHQNRKTGGIKIVSKDVSNCETGSSYTQRE